MRTLIIISLFFLFSECFAQHRADGPCVVIEGNFKIDSLVPAGNAVRLFPARLPFKDTLSDTVIKFKSSIATVAVCEAQLIVHDKMILQYQVNTFDKENTDHLLSACTRYFGASAKSMEGVKSAMYFWSHTVNGKNIHTVLITARGGKKGELVSWVIGE